MADQSTQSITIAAPPAAIMAVIADFPQYPQWAGSVKRVQVLEEGADGRAKQVELTIEASVIRDRYVLRYSWNGDEQVSWTLVSGQMQRSQNGSYRLLPVGDSTEVTYSLAVELTVPLLGMLKRKAERVIMDTALKELKKRVESAER